MSPTSDNSAPTTTTFLSRKQSSHATSLFSMAALMRPSVSTSAEMSGISTAPISNSTGQLPKNTLNLTPHNISSSSCGDILPLSGGFNGKGPSSNISDASNSFGNVAGGILAGLQCSGSSAGSSLHNVFK